jgi:hypothetical protein
MKARRWIDWHGTPSNRNLQQGAGCELTELTKPQFCKFCQLASGEQPKISRIDGCLGSDRVVAAGAPWAGWKAAVLNRLFKA